MCLVTRAVAGRPGLGAVVSAAPQEPAADRAERCGEALDPKNPSHLFALDALFAVYPDALVVQCHQPAETIMASMLAAQQTTAGWSNTFRGRHHRG